MHVPFKIHYRNNLIDKKDSYLIPRPPSWDDRNYSYGHQLYPCEYMKIKTVHVHGLVPERLLTESSERPELLSEKIPVTIRKNHEKTW
jgi:hypothetical protein